MHDDEQPVEDGAQAVVGREPEIGPRIEEHVDGGRDRAAAAVPEDDDQLEALAQVIGRVIEAAEDLGAETVARDADDEEVVRPLVEDELDRHSCVRAAQHGSVGRLLRGLSVARRDAEIAGVDRDHALRSAVAVRETGEQRRDRPTAFVEALAGGFRVDRTRARDGIRAVVAIGELDDLHARTAPWLGLNASVYCN